MIDARFTPARSFFGPQGQGHAPRKGMSSVSPPDRLATARLTRPIAPPLPSRTPQVSVHAADVKRIFSSFSIQVNASTLADLKEDEIVVRLRKAGGASYDKV